LVIFAGVGGVSLNRRYPLFDDLGYRRYLRPQALMASIAVSYLRRRFGSNSCAAAGPKRLDAIIRAVLVIHQVAS